MYTLNELKVKSELKCEYGIQIFGFDFLFSDEFLKDLRRYQKKKYVNMNSILKTCLYGKV